MIINARWIEEYLVLVQNFGRAVRNSYLKTDFRLSRNFLKGIMGDEINLLMAATAWNLKKWLNAFFWCLFIMVTGRYTDMKHQFNR